MHLLQITGLLIIALVICQLVVFLVSTVRHFALEQRQRRLSLELLQQRVKAAELAVAERQQERNLWEGYRKFVVQRKVEEAAGICSFYLTPHDRKPLPLFMPGQYLTFQLKVPGQAKAVIRCYSLSDRPQSDYFRVTIKKVPAPRDNPDFAPGLASNFFHEQVQAGDILDVKAPRGQFVIDLTRATPVVLIAGGIGLTPLLSMANAIAARDGVRETWLFYGVRNGTEHVMKDHLRELARGRDKFQLRVCYSDPKPDEVKGRDYDHGERITLDLLKRELGTSNYEFYVCGPPGMMASITADLKSWGVPETAVLSEAFGPASVPKKAAAPANAPAAGAPVGGTSVMVGFVKSGKTVPWDAQAENLLSFARMHGVDIPSGCCAGNCGTCETAIKSGAVRYLREAGWKAQEGTCLVCIAVPKEGVELDA